MKPVSFQPIYWYTRSGSPLGALPDANGQKRPITTADARRLKLLPSVSNVLSVLSCNPMLHAVMDQTVASALALRLKPAEPRQSVTERLSRRLHSGLAARARFEKAFRSGAQRLAHNRYDLPSGGPASDWLLFFRDWLTANCEELYSFAPQQINTTWGYVAAGDLFLRHRNYGHTVWHIRPQYIYDGEPARISLAWLYEAAAYGYAGLGGVGLGMADLIINTRMPGPPREQYWHLEELREGWDVFQQAMLIWRSQQGYDPTAFSKHPKPAAKSCEHKSP
jgi:hypothetical protein